MVIYPQVLVNIWVKEKWGYPDSDDDGGREHKEIPGVGKTSGKSYSRLGPRCGIDFSLGGTPPSGYGFDD